MSASPNPLKPSSASTQSILANYFSADSPNRMRDASAEICLQIELRGLVAVHGCRSILRLVNSGQLRRARVLMRLLRPFDFLKAASSGVLTFNPLLGCL